MLDRYLPEPRLAEIDHADIGAPPDVTFDAICRLDMARSPLVRTLFELRTLPDIVSGHATQELRLRLADIGRGPQPGFRVLSEEPGRSLTVGAIGKVWEAEIPFVDVPPEGFAAFAEPGYAKVAWEVRCEPHGAGTRVVFEVRIGATDDEAWAHTRRYFRFIGPFSHWIRRHMLALLQEDLGTEEALDAKRPLPGDALLPEPKATLTHAIDIAARPEDVWPYLVQMGSQRAGWYSHDSLDNDGKESAWEILPELQKLEIGQIVPTGPVGTEGYEVLALEPGRVLVLGGLYDMEAEKQVAFKGPRPAKCWQVTWAFVLEPVNERETRLLARARADFQPASMRWKAAWMAPVHHFMQKEQLRNLKARAERRPHDTGLDVLEGIAGAAGMLFDLVTPFLRRARSHWGIDEATAQRPYPGDALVPEPLWSWTHGIEIDAPIERVWPWVAQIGQGKGGFYSYQWLENLTGCEVQNADRVHEEWAHPVIGSEVRLHPKAPPMRVVALEEGRWLLAEAPEPPASAPAGSRVQVSWLFFLEPLDGGKTRFISRFRTSYDDTWKTRLAYGPTITESVGFMMDRRMLLGVKERVEKQASSEPA